MSHEESHEHKEAIERAEDSAADERQKSQAFFAQLALEIRRPSYGVMQKDFAVALLLRAQEAGIFDPTKENA